MLWSIVMKREPLIGSAFWMCGGRVDMTVSMMGGLFFEVYVDTAKAIPKMAFVRHCGAEIEFEGSVEDWL